MNSGQPQTKTLELTKYFFDMSSEIDAPPSYEEAVRELGPVQERRPTRKLNFNKELSRDLMRTTTVSADECIVHLKLLAAIANLRDEVSTIDTLFDLQDSLMNNFETESTKYKAAARIREKRWSVYVTRAVDRFEVWWDRCVPMEGITSPNSVLTYEDIEKHGNFACAPDLAKKMMFTVDNLPPLDVIMVWHAYILNPRIFLDDSLRASKMGFWACGMPWEAIDLLLDERNFEFKPTEEAVDYFEQMTGRKWDNLHDSPVKSLACPKCRNTVQADWTSEIPDVGILTQFEQGSGYANKGFTMVCPYCDFVITHEALRVSKFRRDVNALLRHQVPMPGTLLSKDGLPDNVSGKSSVLLPNRIIIASGVREQILGLVDPTITPSATIADIRKLFDTLFTKQKHFIRRAQLHVPRLPEERLSFRRMMSRYWTNSSPFGLDLAGAVIRQGTFITKMDIIDWTHWPSVESRMDRLIEKYRIFIRIISDYKTLSAVPTLDVDLAWHTHQLAPLRYFRYSKYQTGGRFINHDDKIEENKLSEAFEQTSKRYQSITGGKPYSECICWYCEATRESNNGRLGIFSSLSGSNSTEQAEKLHNNPSVSPDPANNAHISAHNAIRSTDRDTAQKAAITVQRLKGHYTTTFWRLQKRNGHKNLNAENAHALMNASYSYYPIVWGYPVFTPFYMPYGVDASITPELYSSNPACLNIEVGGEGNCIDCTLVSEFTEMICGSAGGCSGGGGGCSSGGCGS